MKMRTLSYDLVGVSDNPDEEIIPNPDNVGSNLPGSPSFLDRAFDPSNFLRTKTFWSSVI